MQILIRGTNEQPIRYDHHGHSVFHSAPGMMRFINSSKRGTVNAVSPWLGLQIIPFVMRLCGTGPRELTLLPSICAISPERCGPGPSSAIPRKYLFSAGVRRSRRTRKKLSSSAAVASREAAVTSDRVSDCDRPHPTRAFPILAENTDIPESRKGSRLARQR